MGVPDELRSRLADLAGAGPLLVASDYDGTLSPMVADPARAVPLPGAMDTLRALADLPGVHVAVVSGRSVRELRRLSELGPPVHLVGSHGGEWSEGAVDGMTPGRVALLDRLVAELGDIAAGYDGVVVETKPASAVLHVRTATRPDAAAALELLETGPVTWPELHVTRGKEVVELSVVATSKGTAIDVLRERLGVHAVLFVGDDVTDEDAFARLSGADVGVKVGAGDTVAAYRVDEPADVVWIFEELVRLLSP